MSIYTYEISDRDGLERIWNKNIEKNKHDNRWIKWKEEYISNNENNKCTTFLVFNDKEPIGEGFGIEFSPIKYDVVKNDNYEDFLSLIEK